MLLPQVCKKGKSPLSPPRYPRNHLRGCSGMCFTHSTCVFCKTTGSMRIKIIVLRRSPLKHEVACSLQLENIWRTLEVVAFRKPRAYCVSGQPQAKGKGSEGHLRGWRAACPAARLLPEAHLEVCVLISISKTDLHITVWSFRITNDKENLEQSPGASF